MEGPLLAVLGHDGSLLRTLACPHHHQRIHRYKAHTTDQRRVACETWRMHSRFDSTHSRG